MTVAKLKPAERKQIKHWVNAGQVPRPTLLSSQSGNQTRVYGTNGTYICATYGIWHVNSTCWNWQILSLGRSSINLMQTIQISKLSAKWKTSWQMSSTTWDWFQNPEDSHGKTPLWHALFFGQSKFLSHIRGNVAGRTWANVLHNEHRILMSPVMRAESWLILSIGTKSWELSPLNHTNHTRLCTFESCGYTCKERKAGMPWMKIGQWMTKRGIKRTGWGMVFWLVGEK